jgi:hypothetical protein
MPSTVDINIAPSTGMKTFQIVGGGSAAGLRDGQTFALPAYTTRLTSSFGPVNELISNGNGSYNAAILEARRRSKRGLEFRVGWTWSKAIDYGANGGPAPRSASQLDPTTNGYDKGLSSLNFPHKIAGSIVWQPHIEHGQRWLRTAANGWRTSAIVVVSAGRPYSYDIFGGTRLNGGRESINGSGGATYLPTIGRNTVRLPDTFHVDLRLERSMTIADGRRLEAWIEAFNLPNHVNYTAVNQRAFLVGTAAGGITPLTFQDAATIAAEGLNTRPFGQYLAASTGLTGARQIQLGARFTF